MDNNNSSYATKQDLKVAILEAKEEMRKEIKDSNCVVLHKLEELQVELKTTVDERFKEHGERIGSLEHDGEQFKAALGSLNSALEHNKDMTVHEMKEGMENLMKRVHEEDKAEHEEMMDRMKMEIENNVNKRKASFGDKVTWALVSPVLVAVIAMILRVVGLQ